VIDSHHAVIGAMGERFVFYRLPELDDDDEQKQTRRAQDRKREEKRMREELSTAVAEFFADLELPEEPPPLSDEEHQRLSALAMLAAHCRSAVERDGYQRTIELILPSEVSTRLALGLEALFSGMLAVGVERGKAWEIVVKVGLDSMPALRRALFEVLVSVSQKLDKDDIAQRIGYPPTTTRRGLEDLAAHRVVDRDPGNGSVGDRWELSAWARQKYEAATAPLPEMSDLPPMGCVPEMSGEPQAPGGNGSVPEMSES
jgi:hypothetical protein